MDEASEILTEQSQSSTRRIRLQLDVSQTSMRRIYKSPGLKAYVSRLTHELKEDDFDRPLEFCETFLSLVENDPDLINRVIWFDEASFKLNGTINHHNSVY
jgi:hypothetical protein